MAAVVVLFSIFLFQSEPQLSILGLRRKTDIFPSVGLLLKDIHLRGAGDRSGQEQDTAPSPACFLINQILKHRYLRVRGVLSKETKPILLTSMGKSAAIFLFFSPEG